MCAWAQGSESGWWSTIQRAAPRERPLRWLMRCTYMIERRAYVNETQKEGDYWSLIKKLMRRGSRKETSLRMYCC